MKVKKIIIITKFNYFKDYCCESDIRKLDLIEHIYANSCINFLQLNNIEKNKVIR